MNYISDSDIRNIVQKVIAQSNTSQAAPTAATPSPAAQPCDSGAKRTIAVGSDHGGYDTKTVVIAYLKELGHTVIDCGTNSKESVDYPDFAFAVADKVRQGIACRGIVIDAAGIGSCMAANKVPGVRAAMCVDYATASNSREHNNANVLSLGAGLLGLNQIKLIIKTFLETDFGGGRHARRVDKITNIEKKFMKEG
jgi:ribose 5-phosphate isomerase B